MSIRIISGKHRGRRIDVPDGKKIRPTGGRTREAIFNILMHGEFSGEHSPFIGKRVVDIFCGTGALGLEALSRGASDITFVDQSQESLNLVRKNAERMGELPHCRFVRSDSSVLPRSSVAHSLAFIDPPYNSGLALKALASLKINGWLSEDAVCVIETASREPFAAPEGYAQFDERKYGNTSLYLLRVK